MSFFSRFYLQRIISFAVSLGIILGLASLLVGSIQSASAAHLVGNGGGTWVCRASVQKELRWAMVVDLFEAQAQFPVELYEGEEVAAIIEKVANRIKEIDPWLGYAFWTRYNRIREQWTPVSGMQLEVIDDALYFGKPAPESCLQGDITYEQAVNFYPDGTVFADVRLLEALDKRGLAALYAHESLYLLFREMFGDTDSRRTRKTVSLLFSTKTPSELITAFDWVLPLSYVSLAVPTFEKLGTYSEKVAPAQFAGRWGFVSSTMRWVLPNRYLQARSFHEGKAAVQTAGGWNFIDHAGVPLLSAPVEELGDFRNGVATAKAKGLWGVLDLSGAWKLEPRFATLTSFSEQGLAIASLPEDTAHKKLHIIEVSGKSVAEISGIAARGFYEGKAAVFDKTWSYVDTAGKLLWGGFTSASDYSAEKAVVKTGAKQWAILNSDGQKQESGTWTKVLLGQDGIVIFCNAVKSKPSQTLCFFHDANGLKQTFPIGDELTSSFENGLATFTRNGLAGFYAHVNSAQAAR